MYSRKAWGGSVDPFILLKFEKSKTIPDGEDPIVSLVIFEWQDHNLIGMPIGEDTYEVSSPSPVPFLSSPYTRPLPPPVSSYSLIQG